MKKIKLKFICLDQGNANGFCIDVKNNLLINLIKKHFVVEYSEEPDYIIYSDYGYPDQIFDYDCVRIHWQQEYVVPDFNVCDYAVGSTHLSFGDRYFRLLPYTYYLTEDVIQNAISRGNSLIQNLNNKNKFCAFVHANSIAPERNRMEQLLSAYKTVSSGGRYKNNIGYFVKDKREFFSQCKFVLAFENTYGYDSDRLVDAFASGSIPIYWGDPKITNEFNSRAFINVHEFDTFEQVVEHVKELDENEDKYLEMLREPIFADGFSLESYYRELEDFLVKLFLQEPEKAYRRNRTYRGIIAENIARTGAIEQTRRLRLNGRIGEICRILHLKSLHEKINKRLLFYGKL